MPRVWRIFAILQFFGVLLTTFGTIDGPPLTAAFLPIGVILLLPGLFLIAVLNERFPGLLPFNDTANTFVFAISSAIINGAIWLVTILVLKNFKRTHQ